jgi:hypothetical protein
LIGDRGKGVHHRERRDLRDILFSFGGRCRQKKTGSVSRGKGFFGTDFTDATGKTKTLNAKAERTQRKTTSALRAERPETISLFCHGHTPVE